MERSTGLPLIGGAIALVIVAGLINLPLPFFGDQALYSTMASMMGDGAVLYIDVWDIKQPGIFGFFVVAGSLFGYSEVGIHLLELIWWTAFMIMLWRTLRTEFTSAISLAVTIVLIGATYYVVASPAELTQVEALVGLPLFASLWFAYRSEKSGAGAWKLLALSGAIGGVAVVFKLVFLPIVAVFWLIAVLGQAAPHGVGRWKACGAVAVGIGITLTATGLVLAMHGALIEALWTSFVHPLDVLGVEGVGYGAWFLRRNATWFAVMFLPVHLLALVGMWAAVRSKRYRFDLYVATWLISGGLVILVQVSSWFTWHFLLVLVPIGIFAGRGTDWLLSKWPEFSRPIRLTAVVVMMLSLVPVLYGAMLKVAPLASNGFALTADGQGAYQQAVWPEYGTFLTDAAFLNEESSPPGQIYVFGDPTYNYLFERQQAISIHGWTPQLLTDTLWDRTTEELVAARPDFIHVALWTENLVATRGQDILALLESQYRIVQKTELGTWYQIDVTE
ncbi:MAG: glycosyltransferase family 39 protein [Acidimicrobiia bacterium]